MDVNEEKRTELKEIPGSNAFVPSTAGLIIASEIIKDLTNKNPRPYAQAKPMMNFSSLARLLNRLQREGYKLTIISWLAKNSTDEYDEQLKLCQEVDDQIIQCQIDQANWNKTILDTYGYSGLKSTLGDFDETMTNLYTEMFGNGITGDTAATLASWLVSIGEDASDPVVGITDLLIHLSADQMSKTLAKGIEGEALDVTFGNLPINDKDKEPVKANVLKLLKEKYDIDEEDFISAEIEVVPAGPARDYGLDRSMIAGYGHDDRCCAYSSLRALLDTKEVEYTACCILVDKEEIGSVGATGAHSLFFENTIAELANSLGDKCPLLTARKALENSKMLSSDVSAAFDPLYAYVSDPNNSAYFANGIVFNKYTGSRGKSGSNDANPEYYAFVRRAMDDANVNWQSSELGKVDQGGGGTIAYILGNYNMNVIDAGIAVLNMHAPMEIISKADLYEAYCGYKAFIVAKD